MTETTRRDEIAAGLAKVEAEIAEACRAVGRARRELTLIAVSKTYPASDVRLLAELGVTDVGENRDQEAAAEGAPNAPTWASTWHFIGQLQTNKVRSVIGYADVVHSVDRPRLVTALQPGGAQAWAGSHLPGAGRPGRRPREGRGGAAPGTCRPWPTPSPDAGGLSAGRGDGGRAAGRGPARAFARLREIAQVVRDAHPGADAISAGMSGDMAQAIANGATHLRVGTALLGRRKPFVR